MAKRRNSSISPQSWCFARNIISYQARQNLEACMIHRPWPYVGQLIDRMADSSILERGFSIGRSTARSTGCHASDLLKRLHPVDKPLPLEKLKLYGLMGLAFEDRAELALLTLNADDDWPFEAHRIGEVRANDVACSPDILMVPKGDDEPFELSLKATWKSCRALPTMAEGEDEFPVSFNYYLDQCMTYALPLKTTSAVLLVYFVCGDYKPPAPQVHGWQLDFSSQEIWETWAALNTIKDEL